MNNIAILLSLYNGEKFLYQQIESIINQTQNNWNLFIRDDGSSDSTVSIISDFVSKDERIHFLEDSVLHRGIKQSFLWLLSQVNADYYLFCDQDDVWLPEKIQETVKILENVSKDIPTMACCDLQLVNQKLEIINDSMWETHHISKLVDNDKGLYIASMFPGCTMGFNQSAKHLILKETYNFDLHDQLVSFVIKKNEGKIIPIHKSLIKYRQHSKNVVGMYAGNNRIVNKIVNLRKTWNSNIRYSKLVHNYLGISYCELIGMKIKHLLNIV